MLKTKVIAEIGVNHNGSISLAKKLIDKAKESGANFAKFQVFDPDELVHIKSKKADYQSKELGKKISQYQMLKKLSISYKDHAHLFKYSRNKKIKYIASGFSINDFLFLSKLGCEYLKVPSGEITNFRLLSFLGRLNKKLIVSTGASNISNIHQALNLLKKKGQNINNVTLLHCTSAYPTPLNEVNLNVLVTFSKKFKTKIGYSDHTNDILTPSIAVAKGAVMIEKHFTLDNKMKGPDHRASLNPKNFRLMIENLRKTEILIGSSKKTPTTNEKKNIKFIRKGIYAKQNIIKNEVFTEKNLILLRPEHKNKASNWFNIVGKRATRNYKKFEKV